MTKSARLNFQGCNFSVHQTVERAFYIASANWVESEQTFESPDAPLVEEMQEIMNEIGASDWNSNS